MTDVYCTACNHDISKCQTWFSVHKINSWWSLAQWVRHPILKLIMGLGISRHHCKLCDGIRWRKVTCLSLLIAQPAWVSRELIGGNSCVLLLFYKMWAQILTLLLFVQGCACLMPLVHHTRSFYLAVNSIKFNIFRYSSMYLWGNHWNRKGSLTDTALPLP